MTVQQMPRSGGHLYPISVVGGHKMGSGFVFIKLFVLPENPSYVSFFRPVLSIIFLENISGKSFAFP